MGLGIEGQRLSKCYGSFNIKNYFYFLFLSKSKSTAKLKVR